MRPPVLRVHADGLVVDSFAGGGGASLGIEWAIGRSPDLAINHDPEAVAMHAANHPQTRHFCEDVFTVRPREVCGGRQVALAWFSPDCTYHSNARGSKPFRDPESARGRRGLAGVVIKWAAQVRPREQLRAAGIVGVVSFSDPVARTAADGRMVFPGHVGTIYQAFNGVFLGRGRPATLRLLPDGSTLHGRALAKLRNGERGWRYVAERLVGAGADAPDERDLRGWANRWLATLARPLRHPGNLKYAWALDRRARKPLLAKCAGPYPKLSLRAA